MNQPLQTAALANLIVASRLPAEGNFRRDAILGAMVGQVNPLAGALVSIRSADSLTALIRERDALRAQQPAPTATGTPDPEPPVVTGEKPLTLDEENRKALQEALRQLIRATSRWVETLTPAPASMAESSRDASVNQDEMQDGQEEIEKRKASSDSSTTPANRQAAKDKSNPA